LAYAIATWLKSEVLAVRHSILNLVDSEVGLAKLGHCRFIESPSESDIGY